jgi:hypothetical protein
MTAHDAEVSGAGAPSRDAQMWDRANWSHIEAQVTRLQERIAKATREGRWRVERSVVAASSELSRDAAAACLHSQE